MGITYYLLIFSLAFLPSNFQNITLFDFKQEDTKSKCKSGLVGGFDEVVFKAIVDYSDDTTIQFVVFQTKKTVEERFTLLAHCKIQEGCENDEFTIGRRLDTFRLEITLSINATISLSGAKIRGMLPISDKREIISGEKEFPQISDFTESNVQLIANGKEIASVTDCNDVVITPPLNILFICKSKVLPCLIEISSTNSKLKVHGEGSALWNEEYLTQGEVKVLVRYAFCRLDEIYQNHTCNFVIENKSSPDENKSSSHVITTVLLTVIPVLILIVILLVLTIKYKLCRSFMRKIVPCTCKTKHQVDKAQSDCEEDKRFIEDTPNKEGEIQQETCIDFEPSANPVIDDPSPAIVLETERNGQIQTYESSIVSHDLKVHFKDCPKHGRHSEFIPANEFLKSLSDMFKNINIDDLSKNIADLCVKVIVSHISDERPQYFHDSNHPYPYYGKGKEKDFSRIGTGLIKSVLIPIGEDCQKCQCHNCQDSKEDQKVRGKIYISTAQSLVFDNSEAIKTRFHIAVNEDTGPIYIIDGLQVIKYNIRDDYCEVECVTCNKSLLDSLSFKINSCKQKMTNVNAMYKQSEAAGHSLLAPDNLSDNAEDKLMDNLTIIVSHPHGCRKHVSYGKWIKRVIVGTDDSMECTKYTYNTPTCPGCIGAFVYILGVSDISLKHHVHCGVNDRNTNFSSTGEEKKQK